MKPYRPPSVKRKPLKPLHGRIRFSPAFGQQGHFNEAVGRMIRNWSIIDQDIIRAIETIESALLRASRLQSRPECPIRFEERLKKLRKLVNDHCASERIINTFESRIHSLNDWTNLRNDLIHGDANPYYENNELRIAIIPIKGRALREDLAYSISFNMIQQEVTGVTAGFGGFITGIIGATEESIFGFSVTHPIFEE